MTTSSDAPSPSPPSPEPQPPDRLGPHLFLRGLGVIYLIAFASLWVQVDGLVGRRGILPIADLLAHLGRVRPGLGYADFPTLCWFAPGDAFLHVQCAAGTAAALLLALGAAPMVTAALCWLLYLSLSVAGQVFLGFQWDALLLEAGFLAIWLAPPVLRSRLATDPAHPVIVVWLLRWLVFRLMFLSGVVKLASGDPTWRNLTALGYHFWTQPLPSCVAWYAHLLPAWAQRVSGALLFVIELLLPFLVFGPRWARRIAAGGFTLLMAVIALTGSYTFFNLLAVLLCLPLLDDAAFPRRLRPSPPARVLPPFWRVAAPSLLAALILLLSVPACLGTCRLPLPEAGPLRVLRRALAPFRSVNGYGLFAVMTRSRPEIVVEGTRDGRTWKPYVFRWKPGDPARRPRYAAPHQPRLDWQMWFAALGDYRGNPWLIQFMARLLEGSPPVLALLEGNPFPDAPPLAVRAVVWEYRFATPVERRAEGVWWVRTDPRPYTPVLQR